MPEPLRQLWTAVRLLLVLTVLLGVGYPAAVWAVGLPIAPAAGTTLGQSFEGSGWFQPRPSAGDYDAQASGGSNLGPNSAKLQTLIEQRRAAVAAREDVAPDRVPADAVTASGSGLDPYVSPAYAELQVARVARERGLDPDRVRALVAEHTQGRTFGFLGQPRVDVVALNRSLAG